MGASADSEATEDEQGVTVDAALMADPDADGEDGQEEEEEEEEEDEEEDGDGDGEDGADSEETELDDAPEGAPPGVRLTSRQRTLLAAGAAERPGPMRAQRCRAGEGDPGAPQLTPEEALRRERALQKREQALQQRRQKARRDERELQERVQAKVLTGESVRKRKEAALQKARLEDQELRKRRREEVPEGCIRYRMGAGGQVSMRLGEGARLYFQPRA